MYTVVANLIIKNNILKEGTIKEVPKQKKKQTFNTLAGPLDMFGMGYKICWVNATIP